MIIVTGTKRSGTSMWMQILKQAGLPIIGKAFLHDWEKTIQDANPEGFFESRFRMGINFKTNPDPKTNAYLHPNETKHHAVKVFIPGLARSDVAFVHRVIATIRDFREYHHSLIKLYDHEHRNREQLKEKALPKMPHPTPYLEWWNENHMLLTDVLTRRYPFHLVAYETVLQNPEPTIRETIEWLGTGDANAAVQAVRPELHRNVASTEEKKAPVLDVPEVDPKHAAVFDELVTRARERRGVDADFIDKLNAVHDELAPRIEEELKTIRKERLRIQRELAEQKAKEKKA